jgi:hypothetical protein
MADKALTPIEQREVRFYDDELTAVRASDGRVYVSVHHMCDALGLTQRGQVLRIQRNEILAEGYQGAIKMITPGGRQSVGMLRVDLVPLWLAGVSIKAVKEEIQPKLRQYQREAAAVLWEAFEQGRLSTDFDELLQRDTEAVEAYKMLAAMLKLARNQVLLEARLDAQHGQLTDLEQRLESFESQLGDSETAVTPDQASQISQAVKAVAIATGKQSGRNEFGAVYGEMYRKFGITSYKLLPKNQFQACMQWLTDWHQEVTGEVPF